MKSYLSPSLMCMDMFDAKNQLEAFNRHCNMLHADIMDAHFAKNLALSVDFVKEVKKRSDLMVDAHLMVENPNDFIEKLTDVGVDYISLHAETITRESFRIIRKIKQSGSKVGIALCPATPFSDVLMYIDEVDILTIMTVEVGYASQQFIPQMLNKIKQADEYRKKEGLEYIIQSDGAVGPKTYKSLYDCGVNAFVMGSSGLFHDYDDIDSACIRMINEFESVTGSIYVK